MSRTLTTTSGLVISTEPAQIADLRKRHGEAQAQYLAHLLEHPGAISEHDSRAMRILGANKADAIVALSRLRDDASRSGEQRLRAIVALDLLDVQPDPRVVARILRADKAAVGVLLSELERLLPDGAARPPAYDAAVLAAINDPNPWRASLAAARALEWKIEGAADAIEKRIAAVEEPPERLLAVAFRLEPSPRTLGRLLSRLEKDRGKPMFGRSTALDELVDAMGHVEEPALEIQARGAIVEDLLASPDQRGITGGQLSALDLLAAHDSGAATLDHIIREAASPTVRSSALERLGGIDRTKMLALATELKMEAPRVESRARRGVTAREAADVLVKHGVLSEEDAKDAVAASASVPDPESRFDLVGRALEVLHNAGRIVAYDMETGTFPNNHDELIREYADGSAGRFRPTHVLETTTPPSDPEDYDAYTYTVEFLHDGRLYRFHPKNQGDWYDVDAVMNVIDRALSDARTVERFLKLDNGGQFVTFVFVRPQAWQSAAAELGIEMSEGAKQTMERAKAYERRVIEEATGAGR